MNTKVEEHLTFALNEMRDIFTQAATLIEAIKPGERRPGTKLAEEIAIGRGIKGAQLYSILKTYLFDNYPGIRCDKGAHGGLYRLTPEDIDAAKVIPEEAKV